MAVYDNSIISGSHRATTMEQEVNETGMYQGRLANMGFMLCRRTLGWSSTIVQGDLTNYLDTSQAAANIASTSTQYYITSSSTEDSSTGTGIRSILINYLDINGYRSIASSITLNGTTPVALPFNLSHIQYIESNLIGSNGVAVGDIYISSKSDVGVPTVAQTIAKISAGEGRSMDGVLKIPRDFTCFLLGWNLNAINTNIDGRLRATIFTHDHSLSPGYHFQQNAYLPQNTGYDEDMHYMALPSLAKIKISAVPANAPAGNRADGAFHFCLVKNF